MTFHAKLTSALGMLVESGPRHLVANSEEELEVALEESDLEYYYDLEEIPQNLLGKWRLPPAEWYYLSKLLVRRELAGGGYAVKAIREAQAQVPPTGGIILQARPFRSRPGVTLDRLKGLYRKCGFRDYGPASADFMVWTNVQFTAHPDRGAPAS